MALGMEERGLSFRVKPIHIIVFMSVINLWLFGLWYGGEKSLQVRQGDLNRTVQFLVKAIERLGPQSYWEEWADTILSDLFTVSELTLESKKKRFMEGSGCPSDMKVIFEEISKWINKGGVTTAFFPESYNLNRAKKQFRVTGKFTIHDVRFQEPIEFKRTYVLGWDFSSKAEANLISLKQEMEDEENE